VADGRHGNLLDKSFVLAKPLEDRWWRRS